MMIFNKLLLILLLILNNVTYNAFMLNALKYQKIYLSLYNSKSVLSMSKEYKGFGKSESKSNNNDISKEEVIEINTNVNMENNNNVIVPSLGTKSNTVIEKFLMMYTCKICSGRNAQMVRYT